MIANAGGLLVCAVKGAMAPNIQFQILLPPKSRTQRHLSVGCGVLCGNIKLDFWSRDFGGADFM